MHLKSDFSCWDSWEILLEKKKIHPNISNIIKLYICISLYLSLNIQNFFFKVSYDTSLDLECWHEFENTIMGFFTLISIFYSIVMPTNISDLSN